MNSKFANLILLGFILTMAICSSSTNSASAVTNCYISGEKQVRITNFDVKPGNGCDSL